MTLNAPADDDRPPADDDRPPADPAESLRLIRQQQAEAARQLSLDPRLTYWSSGLAWLIGFGLFFLRYGPDGRVFVDLPAWLPLASLYTLLVAAGVVTGVTVGKAYGQLSGDSSRRGWMYSCAWFLGFAGMSVTLSRVSEHLPLEAQNLVWAASAVGLTGVLHIAGGAIWLDRDLFTLGVWITLINFAGVLAGPGWHSLIIAVAGGGGMLVAGTIAWLGSRRTA